jgi:hypothetical protein
MRKLLRSLIAGLGFFASAAGATAHDLIGDTKVPFSADRTVTWRGKIYTGKVFAEPGRQRHEQVINGFHPVAILRADRQTIFLILPEFRIYTELPFPKEVSDYGGIEQLGKPIRQETIEGEATRAYRVERATGDGSTFEAWSWLTEDRIVMKVDGSYTEVGRASHNGTLQLSNIVRGPQDPSLFEVPAGLSRLPPEAVQAMFNLRLAKPTKG